MITFAFILFELLPLNDFHHKIMSALLLKEHFKIQSGFISQSRNAKKKSSMDYTCCGFHENLIHKLNFYDGSICSICLCSDRFKKNLLQIQRMIFNSEK